MEQDIKRIEHVRVRGFDTVQDIARLCIEASKPWGREQYCTTANRDHAIGVVAYASGGDKPAKDLVYIMQAGPRNVMVTYPKLISEDHLKRQTAIAKCLMQYQRK